MFFNASSYLKERPNSFFKLIFSHVDLFLAEVHEVTWTQSGLQLVGALQKSCFCNNLAHVHNVRSGLLRLLGVWFCILQRYQLPTKLKGNKSKKISSVLKKRKAVSPYFWSKLKETELTANEAPTGRRIHLGGFFRGLTAAGVAGVWGSCRGGNVCPVPNGSMFPNELLICKKHTESR